jgi:hypothetical protein
MTTRKFYSTVSWVVREFHLDQAGLTRSSRLPKRVRSGDVSTSNRWRSIVTVPESKMENTVKYAVQAAVTFNVVLALWLAGFMLYDPETWYNFVPGVTDTGFYNQHFIRDIGIIQGFIGLAFAVGLYSAHRRIELWAAATLWLIAHAAFHLWEVAAGICSSSVIIRDFPAVSLPAIIGIVATCWAMKQAPAATGMRKSASAS